MKKILHILNWLRKFFAKPEVTRDGAVCEVRLGLPGSGKSLDQTISAVLPHLIAGEEVWCCYWINWNRPNFHYFLPGDFETIKNLRNCVIVFDEVAQMWEPRAWESENSEVRRFFQIHRHRRNDIYLNTQDVSLVSKTIGIVASKWQKIIKIEPTLIDKLLGLGKRISLEVRTMTYQEVKKEANGWELGEKLEELGAVERVNYKIDSIIRQDLDEYKVELYHKYCPKCAGRQGTQIKKENTDEIIKWNEKKKWYELIIPEKCPKHNDVELEIRESGMYDTDYEPEIHMPGVIHKAFKKVMVEKLVEC